MITGEQLESLITACNQAQIKLANQLEHVAGQGGVRRSELVNQVHFFQGKVCALEAVQELARKWETMKPGNKESRKTC